MDIKYILVLQTILQKCSLHYIKTVKVSKNQDRGMPYKESKLQAKHAIPSASTLFSQTSALNRNNKTFSFNASFTTDWSMSKAPSSTPSLKWHVTEILIKIELLFYFSVQQSSSC